jgi:hypothetical protein
MYVALTAKKIAAVTRIAGEPSTSPSPSSTDSTPVIIGLRTWR